jgi:hypothetical protein
MFPQHLALRGGLDRTLKPQDYNHPQQKKALHRDHLETISAVYRYAEH